MIRRYLLSHLQYYHRLKALNYCVRDGNRCDHFNMFAGRDHTGLFTRCDLILTKIMSYWLCVLVDDILVSWVNDDPLLKHIDVYQVFRATLTLDALKKRR